MNFRILIYMDPAETTLPQVLLANQTALVPESLQTIIIISFIVLNVLSIIFVIAYLFAIIRRWKVQSAILAMHKDMQDIKALLTPAPQAINQAPAELHTTDIADKKETT